MNNVARRSAGQIGQKIILNTPVTTNSPIKNIIKITHSNIFIPFSCPCMTLNKCSSQFIIGMNMLNLFIVIGNKLPNMKMYDNLRIATRY